MKYKANPVIVDAYRILSLGTVSQSDGSMCVQIDDEQKSIAELTLAMLARYKPVIGDYLVRQEDGYVYVNPRDVFERKYSACEWPPVLHEGDGIEIRSDGTIIGRKDRVEAFKAFCRERPSLLVNCDDVPVIGPAAEAKR